jgi:hypothetical protein
MARPTLPVRANENGAFFGARLRSHLRMREVAEHPPGSVPTVRGRSQVRCWPGNSYLSHPEAPSEGEPRKTHPNPFPTMPGRSQLRCSALQHRPPHPEALPARGASKDYSTPASFLSLSTSSATSLTLTPALRPPGSSVFSTFSRGFTSAPKSAGLLSSSGFFLAFMMLGSEA